MALIPIPVDLPVEACEVALGPNTGGAALRSASRAAIKRAPRHALGIAYCTVSCAAAEAQDLLQYFQSTADPERPRRREGFGLCGGRRQPAPGT
jgi:hypothetical protein